MYQGQISHELKDILMMLFLNFREVTFEELSMRIENYRGNLDKAISTNIKLEDGPELFLENKEVEKSHNLKRLSEHKNLKVGMISILSKSKSLKEWRQWFYKVIFYHFHSN